MTIAVIVIFAVLQFRKSDMVDLKPEVVNVGMSQTTIASVRNVLTSFPASTIVPGVVVV